MSEELKQFEELTSATSAGSASVTSTHWLRSRSVAVRVERMAEPWLQTYVVDCRAVLCYLDDLYRDVVADIKRDICDQWDLW